MEEKEKKIYRALQEHLDRQAVGFPRTRSGSELDILRHVFTCEEAKIAGCLSFHMATADEIFKRAAHLVSSTQDLESMLCRMVKKGGIELSVKEGVRRYANAPLVVGIYEMQLNRLTPGFLHAFNTYTREMKFGLSLLSVTPPQMRTIPIGETLFSSFTIEQFDDVKALVREAKFPIVLLPCICRRKKAVEGKPCKVTGRKETCLAAGDLARTALEIGIGREVEREDAFAVLAENQREGLVFQPSNTQQAEFICSCCGCCCGMLEIQRHLPRPLDFWASNYFATVNASACNACGICEQRCQVGAIVVGRTGVAVVDPGRCIGCGQCVSVCPAKALGLVEKERPETPPATREELYDLIMANKKGHGGKLKLSGKLLLDVLRSAKKKGPGF